METTNMDLSADGICVLWIWIVNEILYWTQKEIISSNLARKSMNGRGKSYQLSNSVDEV